DNSPLMPSPLRASAHRPLAPLLARRLAAMLARSSDAHLAAAQDRSGEQGGDARHLARVVAVLAADQRVDQPGFGRAAHPGAVVAAPVGGGLAGQRLRTAVRR